MGDNGDAPLLFRAMEQDNGKPRLGGFRDCLGVRVPPDQYADVFPDAMGNVGPNGAGMSVCRSLREMPGFLIPKRLRQVLGIPKARGNNSLFVWSMGSAPFARSRIGVALQLTPDGGSAHGVVEPANVMLLAAYERALEQTRPLWIVNER